MRSLVLLLAFVVTACGFTPMYSANNDTGSNVSATLDQVAIGIIPDREGQYLRNALIDQFYTNGAPSTPQYQLSVTPVRETISDFDITVDSEATRRQLKLTTSMSLVDLNSNQKILSRTLTATTSNNVLQSEFSTLVAERSAREAALNDLARQIEQQIVLYLSR